MHKCALCILVNNLSISIFFRTIEIPSVQNAVRGRGGWQASTRGRARRLTCGRSAASPEKSSTSTVETLDDDDLLGSVPPLKEEPPKMKELSKQTAKRGKPFGNPVHKPLQVKKCSVNLQWDKDENTKNVPQKEKVPEKEKPKSKKGKGKDVNQKDDKKDNKKEKKNQKEQKEPEVKPIKEDQPKPVEKEEVKETKDKKLTEDKQKEEKPVNEPPDTQNEESDSKKDDNLEPDSKSEVEEVKKKMFHIETAMMMDSASVEDIRKDSMEVIGDSLKVKQLEDDIRIC